jgi:hypothetical protein
MSVMSGTEYCGATMSRSHQGQTETDEENATSGAWELALATRFDEVDWQWDGSMGTHHDRGVVHEHINLTPLGDDGADHTLASFLVSNILREEETLPPSGLDELLGLVRVDLLLG